MSTRREQSAGFSAELYDASFRKRGSGERISPPLHVRVKKKAVYGRGLNSVFYQALHDGMEEIGTSQRDLLIEVARRSVHAKDSYTIVDTC